MSLLTASKECMFLVPNGTNSILFSRDPVQLHGALINGLETRVSEMESQLSDLNAHGSKEHDNLANERELHRFILTGE